VHELAEETVFEAEQARADSPPRAEAHRRPWAEWLLLGSTSGVALGSLEVLWSGTRPPGPIVPWATVGLTTFSFAVLTLLTAPIFTWLRKRAAKRHVARLTRASRLTAVATISLMAMAGAAGAAYPMMMRTETFQIRSLAFALVSACAALGAAGATVLGIAVGRRLPLGLKRSRVALSSSLMCWALVIGGVSRWLLREHGSVLNAAGIIPWLGIFAGIWLAVVALLFLLPRAAIRRLRRLAARPITAAALLFFCAASVTWSGALLQGHAQAAAHMVSQHGPSALALRLIHLASDFDGDGASAYFGGGDCAGSDSTIGPNARDIPGNGRDEDCSGGDAEVVTTEWGVSDPHYPAVPESLRKPYDIVMICFDAARADHMGFNGYERPTTPYLDSLAAESWVFENAIAPSATTRMSIAAVFSGRYPSGVEWIPRPRVHDVGQSNVMLAEIFSEGGYQTFAAVDEWLRRFTPNMKQGFDEFDGAYPPFSWRRNGQHAGPFTTAMALDLVTHMDRDQPFLLYLHYEAPHVPYEQHPSVRSFGSDNVAKYDSEIAYADRHLGMLMETLDIDGWLDDAIIVFFSDHGEEFGEHEGTLHGKKLYWESVHVPLVIRVPGREPERFDERVSLVDVLPTLMDLTGVENDALELHGRSLLYTTVGRESDPDRPILSELEVAIGRPDRMASLYYGRHKLIWNRSTDQQEVFDVGADPLEQSPLDDDDLRTSLHDRLSGILSAVSRH
jgi:arylsulfatase A-like enzyme